MEDARPVSWWTPTRTAAVVLWLVLAEVVLLSSFGSFVVDTKPELYLAPWRSAAAYLSAWQANPQLGFPSLQRRAGAGRGGGRADPGGRGSRRSCRCGCCGCCCSRSARSAPPGSTGRCGRPASARAARAAGRRHRVRRQPVRGRGRHDPGDPAAVGAAALAAALPRARAAGPGRRRPLGPLAVAGRVRARVRRDVRDERGRGAAAAARRRAGRGGAWSGRGSWRRALAVVARCAVLVVAVSLYWIIPSVLALGAGATVVDNSETPAGHLRAVVGRGGAARARPLAAVRLGRARGLAAGVRRLPRPRRSSCSRRSRCRCWPSPARCWSAGRCAGSGSGCCWSPCRSWSGCSRWPTRRRSAGCWAGRSTHVPFAGGVPDHEQGRRGARARGDAAGHRRRGRGLAALAGARPAGGGGRPSSRWCWPARPLPAWTGHLYVSSVDLPAVLAAGRGRARRRSGRPAGLVRAGRGAGARTGGARTGRTTCPPRCWTARRWCAR